MISSPAGGSTGSTRDDRNLIHQAGLQNRGVSNFHPWGCDFPHHQDETYSRWWQLKHFLEFHPKNLGKILTCANFFDGLVKNHQLELLGGKDRFFQRFQQCFGNIFFSDVSPGALFLKTQFWERNWGYPQQSATRMW